MYVLFIMFRINRENHNTLFHFIHYVSDAGSHIVIHSCFCTESRDKTKIGTLDLSINNQGYLHDLIPDWKEQVPEEIELLEMKCYFNTVWMFKKHQVNIKTSTKITFTSGEIY